MSSRRVWMILSGLLSILIAIVVGSLADSMAPVLEGTATEFWEALCRADFDADGETSWYGDAYYVDEDWCAYDVGHIHGSNLYRVPTAEVKSRLPRITRAIETNAAKGLRSSVLIAHAAWRESKGAKTVEGLVRSIRDHRDRFWLHRDDDHLVYRIEARIDFWHRWRATRWYWATLVFDWLFLSGWVVFLLWPGIVGGSLLRWCVHLAIAMPMFFVPAYLGYATFTFTSAGPSGGVLYPHLLWPLRGGDMAAEDTWLFEHLPPVLESLSTSIGPPIALTGMGMPGITGVAMQGAIIGATIWSASWLGRWVSLARPVRIRRER